VLFYVLVQSACDAEPCEIKSEGECDQVDVQNVFSPPERSKTLVLRYTAFHHWEVARARGEVLGAFLTFFVGQRVGWRLLAETKIDGHFCAAAHVT
jgi:hypothetical protein